MAYRSAYHEDSDADDEFERSVVASPTLPADFESSPTDSDPPSAEHTPTTYAHSDSHVSPNGLISQWTSTQCADFISSLGLRQYADTIIGMVSLKPLFEFTTDIFFQRRVSMVKP